MEQLLFSFFAAFTMYEIVVSSWNKSSSYKQIFFFLTATDDLCGLCDKQVSEMNEIKLFVLAVDGEKQKQKLSQS